MGRNDAVSNYRYSVDGSNSVRIWDSNVSEEIPIVLQPSNADGTDWTREEAEAWAENWIALANGLVPEESES